MPERKNEHASMDQMSLFSFPFPLPIDAVLPRVASALEQNTRLILEAAPGAGKTTRVPLALCQAPWLGGRKIVMLEPRRLAARAAARYMARLLGEDAGRTVGYRTALDGRESERTRILVVTEGILTRLIQADPGLKGVGCLIFDEFHERSLNADIGLALSLECQEALRPDLRLVVMSATLDSEPLARLLDPCSRLAVEGRGFPVAVRHLAPARPGLSCEEHALSAIHQALREESGGMLVFLPGAAEIRRTALRLAAASLPRGVVVLPLYGDLSSAAQDAAVVPSAPGERKIVLATNIAESSLTIEGVRIVIDAGFVRRQRMDPALGMNRLVTERVSRDSADQRCGRAGRSEHGLCLRLWPEHEHTALQARTRPDILDSDLASLCLELAVWGVPITDEPQAVMVAELVREAALEGVRDELPHSLAVVVDEIAEPSRAGLVKGQGSRLQVRVSLYVERDSQKAIIIGKGGARLKEVGVRARTGIEELLGRKVYLDLHVRTAKDWQSDPKALAKLGF